MGQMLVILAMLVVLIAIRTLQNPDQMRHLVRRFGVGRAVPSAPAARSIESAESLHLRRSAAIGSFEGIADHYGALRTDIADYINHYALFDASVPATAAFDTAYHRLASTNLKAMDVTVLEGWVDDLRSTWQQAYENAQRLGAGALGDARQGKRAAKLAEKAKSVTGAEFDATMQALRAILDVLGVVLPRQAIQRLESQRRTELTD